MNTRNLSFILRQNSLIYIDTATLMNVDEMERFLDDARPLLLRFRRRFIVSPAVCMELLRHMDSPLEGKRSKALRALDVMAVNKDLFSIENQSLDEADIYKAFADAELLSRLTINKGNCQQLLITNDKKLSRDAMELNHLESCNGHRIMVAYINYDGYLNESSESRDGSVAEYGDFQDAQEKHVPVVKTEHVRVDVKVDAVVAEERSVKTNSARGYLVPIGAFLAGVAVDRYLIPAIKNACKVA